MEYKNYLAIVTKQECNGKVFKIKNKHDSLLIG